MESTQQFRDNSKPGESSAQGPHNDFEVTTGSVAGSAAEHEPTIPADISALSDFPALIGRYRLTRLLGKGTYGRVYEAIDESLHRHVAVKVLKGQASTGDSDQWLAEARTLASLEHPAIVPIYDVGTTDSNTRYIVSRLISGGSLRDLLSQRPPIETAVSTVIQIAEAAAYAHEKGFVHRDIKPANILIENDGRPFLADFGLALHTTEFGTGARFVGTPAYMSPEQARMEGHRVDGRSDIYSLGVVLYELLTGIRPFRCDNTHELLDCIRTVEVRPPRQINRSISRELDRVCLKTLAKRATDRYSNAVDFAEELRLCLDELKNSSASSAHSDIESPERARSGTRFSEVRSHESGKQPVVVPKGLRPFDATDADFFPQLLPGARDRFGVPESIRFWLKQIEEQDPAITFRTGVLLGPSGSGKSSFVRAGILPLLDPAVTTLVVESRPNGFEQHLLKRLLHLFPSNESSASLPQMFAAIRQHRSSRSEHKFLLVIDQFEQWLSATPAEQQTELLEALRQCDGATTQAMLLVRDDFTVPLVHFLDQLEEPLLQNHNFAAIGRFGIEHARHVLCAFGQAFGMLHDQPSPEQNAFVDLVVREMEQDGQLIPVQIAIFADIVRDRPWKPETLKGMGGARGVGVKFLEERVSSATAHPVLQSKPELVRSLLTELLPPRGEQIKGAAKSLSELTQVVQSQGLEGDVARILSLLETELRLVSSRGDRTADSVTESGSSQASVNRDVLFQLTHDFMVPAIRQWLSQHEHGSRRGRARIQLRETAQAWSVRQDPKQLPGFAEWISMFTLTNHAAWNSTERTVMRRTSRRIVRSSIMVVLLISVIVLVSQRVIANRDSSAMVARLVGADTSEVSQVISEMVPLQNYVVPKLQAMAADPAEQTNSDASTLSEEVQHRRRLHLLLALSAFDRQWLDPMLVEIPGTPPKDLSDVRHALLKFSSLTSDAIWKRLDTHLERNEEAAALACGSLLAELDANDGHWADRLPRITAALVNCRPSQAGYWRDLYVSRGADLLPHLQQHYQQRTLSAEQRSNIIELLAEFGHNDVSRMAEVVATASINDIPQLISRINLRNTDFDNELRQKLTSLVAHRRPVTTAQPAAALLNAVQTNGGFMDSQCVWFASIPRSVFDRLSPQLTEAGYSLCSLRPLNSGNSEELTGIWHASDAPSVVEWNLPTPSARNVINERSSNGWDLLDFCRISADQQDPTWVLVFCKRHNDAIPVEVLIDVPYEDYHKKTEELAAAGYVVDRYETVMTGQTDLALSATWKKVSDVPQSSSTDRSPSGLFFDRNPGICLTDMRSRRLATLPDAVPILERCLATGRRYPEFNAESVNDEASRRTAIGWIQMAEDLLRLKNEAGGVQKLRTVDKVFRNSFSVHQLWGNVFFSQKNDKSIANMAIAIKNCRAAQKQNPDAILELELKLALLNQDSESSRSQLQAIRSLVESDPSDAARTELLLRSLSAVCRFPDSPLASEARAEFFPLLKAYLSELSDSAQPEELLLDVANDEVLVDPQFNAVLRQTGFDQVFLTAGWLSQTTESRILQQLPEAVHRQSAEKLRAEGFVPKAIVITEGSGQQRFVSSTWMRTNSSIREQIQWARAVTNSALTLGARGHRDVVLLALQDQWGRDVRSNVVAGFSHVASADLAIELLLDDSLSTPEVKRSLLLAIGGCDWQTLTPQAQAAMTSRLPLWSRNTQYPGLKSAALWCSQRWQIMEMSPPESATADSSSTWSQNSIGQLMVALPSSEPFLMGSPSGEIGRNEETERLHHASTGRITTISATEVSETQFRDFINDPQVKTYYRDADAEFKGGRTSLPQVDVSWNDARRFCQWLSQREGIPESEWCYPDAWSDLALQSVPPTDYLNRTGYRLPTEMEWEYAARAGSRMAYHCGQDPETLMAFEWQRGSTVSQSGDSIRQPIGTARPNDFGLFDMLGNVSEWCDDPRSMYQVSQNRKFRMDRWSYSGVQKLDKVLINVRGGSFGSSAENCRAAVRSVREPSAALSNLGFRVARTRKNIVPDSR